MKTPEQLKGAIRNIAASKNLRSQEVLQMFLFERILERLSVSRYRGNFILKGGLLISSMLGISERTPMDMDTTVRGLPLESILAEKYETILRRNIGTTRARDFYDLHTLFRLRRDEVRPEILRQAILHTAKKRGSTSELKEWADILSDMKEEPALASLWDNYIKENAYASDFSFSEVLSTVEQISLIICE